MYRQLTQWEWFQDSIVVHVFLTLLLQANHDVNRWQGKEILPGQIVTGRKSLSDLTGISERSIRTALDKLKSTNELTIKTNNHYSIITITNWESYQQFSQPSVRPASDQRPTSVRPLTTLKEDKNLRREEKEPPLPPWLPVIEWDAYKEMRNKIRKPMTSHAEKLAIKKLENFQFEGKNIIEILNYSILNNYQGIFEPKPQGEIYGRPKQTKLDLIADGIAKARAARKREEQGQTG